MVGGCGCHGWWSERRRRLRSVSAQCRQWCVCVCKYSTCSKEMLSSLFHHADELRNAMSPPFSDRSQDVFQNIISLSVYTLTLEQTLWWADSTLRDPCPRIPGEPCFSHGPAAAQGFFLFSRRFFAFYKVADLNRQDVNETELNRWRNPRGLLSALNWLNSH